MRKFIGAFSAIAAAFAGQAAQASIPHLSDEPTVGSEGVANDIQAFQAANTEGENHNFVLRRTGDARVIMADHESHASHASHASHYSGY